MDVMKQVGTLDHPPSNQTYTARWRAENSKPYNPTPKTHNPISKLEPQILIPDPRTSKPKPKTQIQALH